MRIGEALSKRADIQKRIAQLGPRLQASAVVQEGDTPPEDPARLLAELDELTAELETPDHAINLTNAASRLGTGQTVTAALARRDVLRRARACCAPRSTPRGTQARYSRSEIRLTRQIDVAALRKRSTTSPASGVSSTPRSRSTTGRRPDRSASR